MKIYSFFQQNSIRPVLGMFRQRGNLTASFPQRTTVSLNRVHEALQLVVWSLKLLKDHFLLPIVAELVAAKEVTVKESCDVVNVDLSRLGVYKEKRQRKRK